MGASGEHKVLPTKLYVNILLVLLVLTVITVAAAQVHLPHALAVILAITIATVKAFLVAAYFMHMKYDDKLYVAILVSAVFGLVLLFAFAWGDFVTRVGETSTL